MRYRRNSKKYNEKTTAIIEDRQNYFLFPRKTWKVYAQKFSEVAKPHIFYKAIIVAAKKWLIFFKCSNTDSFIKLYDNILNIVSINFLIKKKFFLYEMNMKKVQIEKMIKDDLIAHRSSRY